MAQTFVSLNMSEFNKRSKDIEIARAIVDSIIKNIDTKKKHIHIISVELEEEGEIYDLTLEKKEFVDILNKNIVHFERVEDFETCILIKKTIQKLNEQK